jgi:uncharacterized protein involved in type VI secretion and phage assembly
MTLDDESLIEVVERLRNRFFGKYRGVVTEVEAETMRIKALVPAVLADQPSGWCRACAPFAGPGQGFAFLPEEGAGVWIEFEGGDVSYPIWSGGFWRDDQSPTGVGAAVRVIATRSGHRIVLDDSDDGPSITITDANDNVLVLEADGMTLQRGDNTVVVTDASVTINDGALEVT